MKTTIWKFSLASISRQFVSMPAGAQILSAQEQGHGIYIWALVDQSAEPEEREIEVLPTGTPAPDANRVHISTVLLHGGTLVFHVFEILP